MKITTVTLEDRINCLAALGQFIENEIDTSLATTIDRSIVENSWFTEEGVKSALTNIASQYLAGDLLRSWANQYPIIDTDQKKIGLVLAGNIPLVGIHDIISVFVSGHIAHIKYSSKDKVLIKRLIKELNLIDDRTIPYFKDVERLTEIDAVIATGGDTAATHFEYYFSKYPHIIRKNRSSVAVLSGNESKEELVALGRDVFTYFGLGCRNVSKVFVPKGYDFKTFYEPIIEFSDVINHNKYKNNYDYTHAIYLLGQHPFLTNNFLIIREEKNLASRISCLHYEEYEELDNIIEQLGGMKDQLQCIASAEPLRNINSIRLGMCQSPAIDDYADGVDTMAFLTGLYD